MIKRILIGGAAIIAIAVLAPAPASAQSFEIKPMEFFIGAGAVRFDVDNEIGTDIPAQTAWGLQVDMTYYVDDNIGIVGEVGWIDTDLDLPEDFAPIRRLTGSQISLMVGGRARFLPGERFQVRVHGLIGAARQDVGADVGVGIGIPELTGTAVSFAFGASFDIALQDEVAIRFQPDVLITTHDNPSTSFRFAFGVVF